jgi:hypothetical protein
MSNASADDRRHFHRVSFEDEATLKIGDRTLRGRVHDLSLKGALVDLDEPGVDINPHDIGTLSFPLSPDLDISMGVTVAHVEGSRVGVHCDEIDLESMQHLKRLVELNLGDTDLLHRDLAAMFEAPDAG